VTLLEGILLAAVLGVIVGVVIGAIRARRDDAD
jgi:ABC-type nitrate/sulfonate/bicarbonate transport system permease component